MITYINSANASRYSSLFKSATEALAAKNLIPKDEKGELIPISTLEQYFSYMEELPKLTDNEGREIGRKYTILPLDEEVFEIDANSRTIHVPTAFKNNGIGVQGDQISEIVYFKIDRFFDATDLNEMDIYIQWEAPNGDKGVSVEWVRDIESEPGKIIFGWPLSLDITSVSGVVKFSVRFFKTMQENGSKYIAYSFSTLTASATIKPALDFNLLSETLSVVDNSALIAKRFTKSEVVGGEKAIAPEYFINLDNSVEYDLNESGECEFIVHAYSIDGGLISYAWFEGNGQDAKEQNEAIVLPSKIIYVATDDKERVPGKIYYIEVDKDKYEPYIGEDFSDPEMGGYVYYEKHSVCKVDKVGKYYAKATNRKYFNTAAKNSNTVIIPGPVVPTISKILNEKDEEISRFIIRDGETLSLKVHAVAQASDAGKISYAWKRVNKLGDTNWETVGSESELNILTEGVYKVYGINTRNNEALEVEAANTVRVTGPAKPVELKTGNLAAEIAVNTNFVIDVNNDIVYNTNVDSLLYRWYKVTADKEDNDILIPEVSTNAFKPTEVGTYRVEIYSEYNGDVSEPVGFKFNVQN